VKHQPEQTLLGGVEQDGPRKVEEDGWGSAGGGEDFDPPTLLYKEKPACAVVSCNR
jgi:hypothetical protein